MKINILLCDTFEGLLPENIISYSSLFENLFNPIRSNIEYVIYNVWNNEFPPTIEKGAIYLIPGSRAGAYDDIAWVKSLIIFIREAYANDAKLIGVCFGHQVIAQALGGKVEKASVGWGIGVRSSLITDNQVSNYFENGCMRLMYNHNDQVVVLPPNATLFATSEFCPNEGFFIGKQVLTFQGHPEYTVDYNKYLLLNHAKKEPEVTKKMALKTLENPRVDNHKIAKWILDFVS